MMNKTYRSDLSFSGRAVEKWPTWIPLVGTTGYIEFLSAPPIKH
jgi:hypothetical protein